MSFDNWKRWKVTLTVETPIFIGSGEEITPMEYVAMDSGFYFIGIDRMENFLKSVLAHRWHRDSLLKFFDSMGKRRSFLLLCAVIEYLRKGRDPFCERNSTLTFPVNKQVYKLVHEALRNRRNYLYRLRCSICPDNRSKVKEFIKTVTPQGLSPYVPGTTIKGALRTALIWNFLMSNEIVRKNIRENFLFELGEMYSSSGGYKISRKVANIHNELIYKALNFYDKSNSDGTKPDPHHDIGRFIRITDSIPLHISKLSASLFVVAHKDRKEENGQAGKKESKREERRYFAEVLSPGTKTQFYIQISSGIVKYLRDSGLLQKPPFSSDDPDHVLKNLITSFKDFSKVESEYLKSFFANEKLSITLNMNEDVENKLENAPINPPPNTDGLPDGEVFIRIGTADFINKTVNTALEDWLEDGKLQHKLSRVYPTTGPGNGVFPRTKKLVYWNERWHFPGWVRLKFEEVK